MAGKYKSHAHFSVRTPEALAALQRWLDGLPDHIRERGRTYFLQGRVKEGWAGADHFVEADVVGSSAYNVTLFLTRGKWTGACTCPVGNDCKHTAATAIAWIEHKGADFEDHRLNPPAEAPAAPATPAAPAAYDWRASHDLRPHKATFRETWSPVLAEKLGRPLTDEENHLLGQLSATFNEFKTSFYHLHSSTLRQHGFGDAIPRSAPPYGSVFDGWWRPSSPPADPWRLWQYIAFSLEQNGHPIPEAFRPMTNTAQVRVDLEDVIVKDEIHAWRRALQTTSKEETTTSPVETEAVSLRARVVETGEVLLETRAGPDRPWKAPSAKWTAALPGAVPADFEDLAPAEAALALTIAMGVGSGVDATSFKRGLPESVVTAILRSRAALGAMVRPDGSPFIIEPEPLVPEAQLADARDRLTVHLVMKDGTNADAAQLITTTPQPLYVFNGAIYRGPPPLPKKHLPVVALGDGPLMTQLRRAGLRLPANLALRHRVVKLRPRLRMRMADAADVYLPQYFCVQLFARGTDPVCEQHWSGMGGWQWTKGGAPPPRRPEDPVLEFDLTEAQAVSAKFPEFRLTWNDWYQSWVRPMTKAFPDELIAWRAALPPELEVEAAPELSGFFQPALRATLDVMAQPSSGSRDWFDLTVALRVEDTTLTHDEIALLLKAKGKWVQLPKHGWRRLEFEGLAPGDSAVASLDRLGLTAADVLASGKPATHRVHALQLAAEAAAIEARDTKVAAALRERVAKLAATPLATIPTTLTATLRPYQQEGFQFLAHLSALGFGGVLADDMGLGKTVQSLAWLLHLKERTPPSRRTRFRALVVCPKSVMHGWLTEAARFAPTLTTELFTPLQTRTRGPKAEVLIANYTQLRLNGEWLSGIAWDVVVLDEGQFIKNPTSLGANIARGLNARHRLVLTGTPVENRLTDLWSLFAFAQPGLLGAQSNFRRQYDEKEPDALERLHRRVRHFLLRRTKAQAAPDLPPRTEDEIEVDLEPEQRKLYDAELKLARQQLLGISTDRDLDKVRFNILSSLLRLRQICCHPALLDRAHAELPSAKLEALLERLEELRDEGHQVLVFSQFVEMLELIRAKLVEADIAHLMLTGQTENRAELVEQFQTDKSKTVFLLSLRAAGFGLNLTAASYAVLYDPWWNPAVEAQAIDRTHRIGQTRPVMAYRIIACDTIEQKIRQLQQEKAALAAAVVQEESLAHVLDLESLKRILS